MPRRFVDISVALEADIASDPPIMLPKINYLSHADTAGQIAGFFPGLTQEDLPGGEGWAVEFLNVATHNGTHLDAPYHHHSTMDGGKRAITIDEVPLEWCMNPGVKLDFRDKPDGYVVSAAEVEAELKRIGHDLQPLDIVVVNTAAGARYGQDDYVDSGCGMGREATLYLLEKASASPAPTPGPGTRRSRIQRNDGPKPTTRRSSGRATAPQCRSAIATWKNSAISRCYRPPASPSAASR